jgi:cellulose synthase operon protein C
MKSFRLLVLLCLALLAACSRDPNVRKQKYFESGQRYFEKGKYREAAIQFGNAVQVDPHYAQAHYQLAQTYLRLQDWSRAYQELTRTIDVDPKNTRAHLDIANLLIAGRQFPDALHHLDVVQGIEPANPELHVGLANLNAAQNNLPEALQEMKKAIELGPDRAQSYLELALLELRANDADGAESNFKKAVTVDPKAMNAQLALGSFYQSRSRFPEAEQQFRHAMEVDPKNPEPRASLARLYMAEGKKAEAEEFLRKVKGDFPDNSVGYRMLGDFYFANGDVDKAVAEYGALYQQHPRDLQLKKNYVQLLILKNRLDEARKLDNEILKGNPSDTEALIFKGQIALRDLKPQEAVDSLQTAIKNDPDNGVAHYHLGAAFDQLGNLERAESEWRQAVKSRPDLVDAQRALAGVAIRKSDVNSLAQAADQIINFQPTAPDGYIFRSIAEINRRQATKAEDDIHKAIEVAPQSPVGYVQMGNFRLLEKKYKEAESYYQQALDRDPNSVDALSGMANLYLTQKQPDNAIAAVNSQLAKAPNNSGFHDLLGTLLYDHKKDAKGAEAELKKAVELDNKNSDALMKLGRVQALEGQAGQAIATYEQSLKTNPRDFRFYILIGELYEYQKDWDHAKDYYQKALGLQPDNALASNNLAYVMLQQGGNVDVALSMAQTARRGMPDSPNVADTLGWAYYQKGVYNTAVDLFKEAVKKSPDDPTFHYHLGLAYQKTNQPALAKEHLQRVLTIKPDYSDANDVRKALAQLRG